MVVAYFQVNSQYLSVGDEEYQNSISPSGDSKSGRPEYEGGFLPALLF